MTYVITFACIGVKDASCVEVCPVDCIHPTPDEPGFEEAEQLYINPDECIACGACETACPVSAIFEDHVVPDVWKHFIKKNADFFAGTQQPSRPRRMMQCGCGRGKAGRRSDNDITRKVTTQLVLIEPRRRTATPAPFTPYPVTRVVLVERHQRRKDA